MSGTAAQPAPDPGGGEAGAAPDMTGDRGPAAAAPDAATTPAAATETVQAATPDAATGTGPAATPDLTAGGIAAFGAPGADIPAAGSTPGGQPWWRPKPFPRPAWYPAVAAVAVVALLAGVAMTLLTLTHRPRVRPLAADCGLVTCGASLPPAVTGNAVPNTAVRSTAPARRHHRRVRPRVLAPTTHTRVSPLPPARPRHRRHRGAAGPPAPAAVGVSYSVDGTDPWNQGFHAHLTIVNNGSTPVAGWTVQLSLPGDQVDWVGYPGAWQPFSNWQFGGGTLVLNAVSGGETIAPGATEIVPVAGQGTATAPAGCTFNGASCQP
jgi:cellulose binding protein with CBM2 domain